LTWAQPAASWLETEIYQKEANVIWPCVYEYCCSRFVMIKKALYFHLGDNIFEFGNYLFKSWNITED
jgi:hypothetical protein